jgi:hypothetical protein
MVSKGQKGMCEDDLSTKIGGEVQVIETALKIFCPTYWFQKGDRDSTLKEQHWESPVPGTYKFLPGLQFGLEHVTVEDATVD